MIRLREEIAEQKKALKGMKEMAKIYGFDISRPAKTAKEAIQWMYFGYLAAIKTQNGAAMSIGRVATFLDIYIQRDLDKGIITEEEAQEMIDHLTMKFRMVKFARIPSYNQLFSGDPVWATLDLAGIGVDGRSMVTKTDFRFLHTLENMGPSPEPNITVLYSSDLPENFKKYAADISIRTSSIQYENDDVMKPVWGDDYAICCLSLIHILFSTIAKKVNAYSEANPDKNIIRLGIGDVTQPLAPAIIDSLHKAVDEMGHAETFHGYAPDLGYEFLRNAIAKNDYQDRGADIKADEIFVSDGAKCDSGNIQEIFAQDNKIAVCDPVYPVYVDTNVMAGRAGTYDKATETWSDVIYMPCTAENNFAPDFPSEVPDIIYLCFPNNPTGSTITKDQLQGWVDLSLIHIWYLWC